MNYCLEGCAPFWRPAGAVNHINTVWWVCSSHRHQNCGCFHIDLPTSHFRKEWRKQSCLLKCVQDQV